MDLLFLGLTLGIMGEVLIGVAVLRVHSKVVKEHKIDTEVFKQMHQEKIIAHVGIIFMILGYSIKLVSHGYIF